MPGRARGPSSMRRAFFFRKMWLSDWPKSNSKSGSPTFFFERTAEQNLTNDGLDVLVVDGGHALGAR